LTKTTSSRNRWQEIADEVRRSIEAGELRPGDKLPSGDALAAEWKVNRLTAHRAVSELQRLGLVIRNGRSGTIVTMPRAKATGHIALLSAFLNIFPHFEYIRGMRSELPEAYHLLLCETGDDPRLEADYLERVQYEVDGILCNPTCAPENTALLQRIIDAGVPIVCVDKAPEGLTADAVMTDNHGSTLAAMRQIIARGHTRIAFFSDNNLEASSVVERYSGYKDALQEIGVADPSKWTRHFPIWSRGLTMQDEADFEMIVQLVQDALDSLMHRPEPPTAVFCIQDKHVDAVMEAARRLEINVPDQLTVVGFSDWPNMVPHLSSSIQLTTDRIVQRKFEIGQQSVRRLLSRIERPTDAADIDHAPAIIRVPADFFPAGQ